MAGSPSRASELAPATPINVWSLLLGLWLALLAPPWASAVDFHGKVVGVADGDTITVLHDGQPERVRLQGIDCPEQGQAFGQRAKQATSRLAFGQVVTVRAVGKDRFGRTLGEVLLPDGQSLNRELVRQGFAWWFRRYSTDETLAALEAEARTAHRGLWADRSPTPPWEWRQDRRGVGATR